jgi:hypothetical protein
MVEEEVEDVHAHAHINVNVCGNRLGRNNPGVSYLQINRDITRDYLIMVAISNTRKKEPMVGLHNHDNITKCYCISILTVCIL